MYGKAVDPSKRKRGAVALSKMGRGWLHPEAHAEKPWRTVRCGFVPGYGEMVLPIPGTRKVARAAAEAGTEAGAALWVGAGGLWLERKLKSGGQRWGVVGAWRFDFMRKRRRDKAIREVLARRPDHAKAKAAGAGAGGGGGEEEGNGRPGRPKMGWVDRLDSTATAAAAVAELRTQYRSRAQERQAARERKARAEGAALTGKGAPWYMRLGGGSGGGGGGGKWFAKARQGVAAGKGGKKNRVAAAAATDADVVTRLS